MSIIILSLFLKFLVLFVVLKDTPMVKMMPPNLKESLIAQKQFPKRLGKASEFGMLVQHIAENPYLNGECIRLDAAVRMQPK